MLRRSSKRALQLDEADALLAGLGGLDQCRHEGRLVARAVHRRLDRNHVGVAGGCPDERLDARPERLVRKMDEDVGAPDLLEQVAGALVQRKPRLRDRAPLLVFELGPVEPDDLLQVGQVEEAVDR